MTREELIKLADKYQSKADANFQRYQETGISRYGSSCRRDENIAEALRAAADAADEHQAYISMKAQMADFAWRAQTILHAANNERETLVQSLVHDIASYGQLTNLIRRDGYKW